MPVLKLIEEHEASEEVKETYAKVKARYGGFLPNIYKAFANDPSTWPRSTSTWRGC